MSKDNPLALGPERSQSAITEAFFTHGDYSMQFEDTPESEPFLATTPRPSTLPQPQQQQQHPIVSGIPEAARNNNRYMNASVHVSMDDLHIPYETLEDGKFLSRSMLVNTGGEELHRFLIQRSVIQPKIVIRLQGSRRTVQGSRSKTKKDGTVESTSITHLVDDFNYEMDCTKYLRSTPDGFKVLPDRKTGEIKSVQELCDDYVRDPHRIKELQLTKVVDWDTALVQRVLTKAIRRYGYSHSLKIDIETRQNKVLVKPGSWIAKAVDNPIMVWFCYLTFLWIITWPLLFYYRRRYGHDTLQSIWRMNISKREWCEENMDDILGQIPLAALDSHSETEQCFPDDNTLLIYASSF